MSKYATVIEHLFSHPLYCRLLVTTPTLYAYSLRDIDFNSERLFGLRMLSLCQ